MGSLGSSTCSVFSLRPLHVLKSEHLRIKEDQRGPGSLSWVWGDVDLETSSGMAQKLNQRLAWGKTGSLKEIPKTDGRGEWQDESRAQWLGFVCGTGCLGEAAEETEYWREGQMAPEADQAGAQRGKPLSFGSGLAWSLS